MTRPSWFERIVTRLAWAMIAVAAVVGALSGLALLGVASFGPAVTQWASGRGPGTVVLAVLVAWPLLGVLSVLLEGFFESLWSREGHGRLRR